MPKPILTCQFLTNMCNMPRENPDEPLPTTLAECREKFGCNDKIPLTNGRETRMPLCGNCFMLRCEGLAK